MNIEEHNTCQRVTNQNELDLFIPTKTEAEWQSFLDNTPENVIVGACLELVQNLFTSLGFGTDSEGHTVVLDSVGDETRPIQPGRAYEFGSSDTLSISTPSTTATTVSALDENNTIVSLTANCNGDDCTISPGDQTLWNIKIWDDAYTPNNDDKKATSHTTDELNNIFAWFKADEGWGNVAYDSSGNGNDGTHSGGATHTIQNIYSFQNEVGYSKKFGLTYDDQISLTGGEVKIVSFEDNNTIKQNDVEIGTLNARDTITVTTVMGDRFSGTGAFSGITINGTYGTASLAPLGNAGENFVTNIYRNSSPYYFYIYAVNDDANVTIKNGDSDPSDGGSVTILSGETIKHEVNGLTTNKAIRITSDYPILIYAVGSSDYDGRLLYPATKTQIGWRSSSNSAQYTRVVALTNSTTVTYYTKNNNSNSSTIDADAWGISVQTTYYPPEHATLLEADKPVTLSTIGDGDGSNATDSRDPSTLENIYYLAQDADWVSFASTDTGIINIYNNLGDFVSSLDLETDRTDDKVYAAKYDSTVQAGYRFECSVPCIAVANITEGNADGDETVLFGITDFPVYIPRNENNTEYDVLGNTLDYSGQVKYNARLVESNTGSFDGVDDHVKSTTGGGVIGDGSRSMFGWVKTSSGDGIPFSMGTTNADNNSFALNLYATNEWRVYGQTTDNDKWIYVNANVLDGEWHHVGVTYDNSSKELSLYSDGQYINNGIRQDRHGDWTGYNTSEGFVIGGWAITGDREFNGQIADVRVFDRVLSSDEVSQIYNGDLDVASTNLAGWWPLAEGGGSTAYDVSETSGVGNDNHGTITGMTWTTQDVFHYNIQKGFSGALDFDGSGDHVKSTTGGGVTGDGSRSMFGWVKNSSGNDVPFSMGTTNADNNSFALNLFSSDTWKVYGQTTAYDEDISGVGNAIDGKWHHVGVTYDNSNRALKLYLDGQFQVQKGREVGEIYATSEGFVIGGWAITGDREFDGQIADVRVFDTVLDQSEVVQVMNGEDVLTDNLVGHWKLNEMSGDYAYDSSGNNHTGTINGDPQWTYLPALADGSGLSAADGTDVSNPADYWHNNAETKFRNYTTEGWTLAPALAEADSLIGNFLGDTSGNSTALGFIEITEAMGNTAGSGNYYYCTAEVIDENNQKENFQVLTDY